MLFVKKKPGQLARKTNSIFASAQRTFFSSQTKQKQTQNFQMATIQDDRRNKALNKLKTVLVQHRDLEADVKKSLYHFFNFKYTIHCINSY